MRNFLMRLLNRTPVWVLNTLFTIFTILVMVGMFLAASAMFWLKMQAASFMFG